MFESYFETALYAFTAHPYAILFVGLLLAGESILLPAIYLAIAGRLSMPYVVAIAMLSTTLADLAWFYIGRHMAEGVFRRFVSDRVRAAMDRLSKPFDAHMGKALFISKFVYGTRTAAQVLAGARGMPLRAYVSVNFLGILALTLSLIALGFSADFTVVGLESAASRAQAGFLIFLVAAAVIHIVAGKIAKKTWFRQ
jgi:membrane protein DedA with SNARE-associated domain